MAQKKQVITILSIDGGGIRGIIPATILRSLEKHLQEIDGENVRISDYFDIIAGTSTGSLIAALLVAPVKENNRPRTASEITDFYHDVGPLIFSEASERANQEAEKYGKPPKGCCGFCRRLFHCTRKNVAKGVTRLTDPVYDRKHLDSKVQELLGDLKLSDTPKTVVIPAFDLKEKAPVVFSTKQSVKRHRKITLAHLLPKKNITLAKVVISSSAAPYYFPSHRFAIEDQDHDLIDGGIAANNPVLLAIGEAKKEYPKLSESFECYRILSIGTGAVDGKSAPKYLIGRGGILDMMVSARGGTPPLVDMMFRANAIVTDMYTSTVLGSFNQFPHYLRIQEYDLKKELDTMNTATTQNLDELQKVAKYLMKKPVTVADAFTGLQEKLKGPDAPANNGDALAKFATMLAEEKKAKAKMNT